MKGIVKSTLLLSVCYPSYAEEVRVQSKWQPGFSGHVTLMTGIMSSSSQEDSGEELINSLESEGTTSQDVFVFPLAASEVTYTFENGQQRVVAGTSNTDLALGRPHVQFGYQQNVEQVGTFGLMYIPGIIPMETWQDPYLVGEAREETDRTLQGLRFQYSDILDSAFGLEISAGKVDLDREQSASQYSPQIQQQMRRQGYRYFAELSHTAPMNDTLWLRSSGSYLRQSNEGDATSSNTYTAQIGVLKRYRQSMFSINTQYKFSDYDAMNPIFLMERKDSSIGLVTTYSYQGLFGLPNLGAMLLASFRHNESNIDFYTADSLLFSAGLNYRFN